MMITGLGQHSLDFPDISNALEEPNGLLALGGDLGPERLLAAYQRGIFPWYEEGQPILWWSPDPRMVLFPPELHVSRSLRKALKKHPFTLSADTAFAEVIHHCAGTRSYADGTWITSEMEAAYLKLHELGFAHSIEAWQDDVLVGGLYGISIGPVFFGESMFSHVDNASKIAFVHLVKQLEAWEYKLIDCQVSSEHLASFGARDISRHEFQLLLPTPRESLTPAPHWPEFQAMPW